MSIGQTIFSNTLLDCLPKYAPSLDPRLVLGIGATQLRQVIPPSQLPGVLEAYANSIDKAFILPAALGGACLLVSFFVSLLFHVYWLTDIRFLDGKNQREKDKYIMTHP